MAGGVGAVAGHQLVAPGHPPVALDIPVDTLLDTGHFYTFIQQDTTFTLQTRYAWTKVNKYISTSWEGKNIFHVYPLTKFG